ncbi:hypothetical protein [Pseudoduganella namucuonensis]|nr:hypothetical protein [Pseudoduganella namucuonensis]
MAKKSNPRERFGHAAGHAKTPDVVSVDANRRAQSPSQSSALDISVVRR